MNKLIKVILLLAVFATTIANVFATDEDKPTIYITGDSTAQTYRQSVDYPEIGWGQVFGDLFTDKINIENRAVGGRSAKKFDSEGRLEKIFDEIKPGDFLFVQFGINDGDKRFESRYSTFDEYKRILKERYIEGAKKHGAIPVLMTPSAAASWDEAENKFTYSRVGYAEATREVASETGCKFIDINKKMTDTYNNMDKDDVLSGYLICEPLESVADPIGLDDHSHFKEKGARRVAKMIVGSIPECVPELSKYLRNTEYFSDISGHVFENEIKNTLAKGLIQVNIDGKFEPDKTITRAEFLKMVMDAAKINGHARRDGECLGVTDDDWYCYYLQGALDRGLIPLEMIRCDIKPKKKIVKEAADNKAAETVDIISYVGGFRGDDLITREEMAFIAINCFITSAVQMNKDISPIYSEDDIKDDTIDPAFLNPARLAYSYGLVGLFNGGSFRPKDTVTRAEAMFVINRIAEKLS